MTSQTFHMSLSVRGALGWPKRMLREMFRTDDGHPLTPDEARDELMSHLSEGHEVLPMGSCEGFDFRTGCPGHEARRG